MAPSTACSASLLHGAWRPAKSRSVEETAGDADVIPGRLLPIGVPEQGGRMVRNDNRDAPEPVDLVAERAQRLFGVEQRLRRGAAHRENRARLDEVDLAEQVRQAGRSEERRVGKECRSRWSPDHLKKKRKYMEAEDD